MMAARAGTRAGQPREWIQFKAARLPTPPESGWGKSHGQASGPSRFRWVLAFVLAWGAVLLWGCASSSPRPSDPPLLALAFPSRQAEEVGTVAVEVFQRAGYEVKRVGKHEWEFLRRSGSVDQAIYGGLVSAGVWERVRIRVVADTGLEPRLELRAEKVRSPGDQVFEEAHRITNPKRYQAQVAALEARLK